VTGGTGGASGTLAMGGAGEGGAAGQAGESNGGAATFPDGCVDLDQNGVSDCTETMLDNSAFATDVSHWTAEANTTITWDAKDMLGSLQSGSALVTSSGTIDAPGDAFAAADQCVTVSEGQLIDIYANAEIAAGQAAGKTAIGLWFFPADACPGDTASDVYETSEAFDTGQTITLRVTKLVQAQMRSMRVRLGVIKPFRAASFSVRFDNVLIHAL
jgi:hypothetical protein